MGLRYGHASRMMLNFDVVFLSELLSALEGQSDPWQHKLRPYHCLELPKADLGIPQSLDFAAAANLLLAELKVDDNIKDSRSIVWRGVKRVYRPAFLKVNAQFAAWGFETGQCWEWIKEQEIREEEGGTEQSLMYFAEPTAELTATVFEWGVQKLGKPELAESMRHIGYHFGALMYKLDALEDFEEDAQKGTFNGIRAGMQDQPFSLNCDRKAEVIKEIESHRDHIQAHLPRLPIEAKHIRAFQNRLTSNLQARTHGGGCACPIPASNESEETIPLYPRWWKPAVVSYAAVVVCLLASQLHGAARMDGGLSASDPMWSNLLLMSGGGGGAMGIGWWFFRRKWKRKLKKGRKQKKKNNSAPWWQWIFLTVGALLTGLVMLTGIRGFDPSVPSGGSENCLQDCCEGCVDEWCYTCCGETCCEDCCGGCCTGCCTGCCNGCDDECCTCECDC